MDTTETESGVGTPGVVLSLVDKIASTKKEEARTTRRAVIFNTSGTEVAAIDHDTMTMISVPDLYGFYETTSEGHVLRGMICMGNLSTFIIEDIRDDDE